MQKKVFLINERILTYTFHSVAYLVKGLLNGRSVRESYANYWSDVSFSLFDDDITHDSGLRSNTSCFYDDVGETQGSGLQELDDIYSGAEFDIQYHSATFQSVLRRRCFFLLDDNTFMHTGKLRNLGC